ncbi:MAG: response regulator [Bacteroidia bacterium]|nr:response regulator [Bacteroidia bacterium]
MYDLLSLSAAQKHLEFTYKVDDRIPRTLLCDALRLNQILINLVGNAIKFTEKGSVRFFVELLEVNNDLYTLKFRVIDTGIGIESEKQKSIFERFNQVNNEINRKYEGTGLGLSISKNLIELLGGNLIMNSELGQGSEFTFNLQLKAIQDSEIDQELNKINISNSPIKLRILLVEDNQLNQKLAKNVLNNFGFEVVIADNGLIGLEILKSQVFDLILMDIQMPELDGYQTTRIIRNELKLSIPIIAMTAHSILGEKEKCLDAGMNDFISKPFNQKELHDKISTLAEINSSNSTENKTIVTNNMNINLTYLQELSNGNKSFEAEMISLFLHQVPKEMLTLQRAFDDLEYTRIAETAHKLKSSMDIFNRSDLSLSLQAIIDESKFGHITSEMVLTLDSILSKLSDFYPMLDGILKTRYEAEK